MAENYEPLAPPGGTPPPPPPPPPAAVVAPTPIQATPAAAPPSPAPPFPPLLPPKKPVNQLPLARKNPKPQILQSSSAVSLGPLPGEDKISENITSNYGNEENVENRDSGKGDLISSGGNYEESISTGKTSKNNVRFYCMITSGIMGGFFALTSIVIGIFTFVRQ
uniref:Uncharacterized protein n=1 Tax=Panagrolaimus superbus TaxID=310955 RepID=A0A914YVQ5_9BILA